MDNGCGIYHCRHTDSDHPHGKILFIEPFPVVSHTGPRIDPGICNLNGTVQPCCIPGCQRINGNYHIRLCLRNNTLNNFQGFHSGLSHYPRRNPTDLMHFHMCVCLQPVFPDYMPCHMKTGNRTGAKGIRSDLLISKSYHQDRLLPSKINQLP